MNTEAPPRGSSNRTARRAPLSIVGMIAGTIALLAAAAPFALEDPRRPTEKSLREVLRDTLREIRSATQAAGDSAERSIDPRRVARNTSIAAGVLAFLLGTLAWVRREPLRPAIAAIGLGAAAIAWQIAMAAFLVALGAILIIILFWLFSISALSA